MNKMVEELYMKNKMGLKVSKSSLTRAISSLEESCKMLDKSPETASSAPKLRLSGSVLEAHEIVSEKEEKVRDYYKKLLESTVAYIKFKKISNTPKEDLLKSVEKDMENYETSPSSA